jgi:hypothetical protein
LQNIIQTQMFVYTYTYPYKYMHADVQKLTIIYLSTNIFNPVWQLFKYSGTKSSEKRHSLDMTEIQTYRVT